MSKTIKLIHVAGPFGDETSRYDITFPNMTVADFILTVLKENPDEWGTIRLNGEIICEYKKGKITSLNAKMNVLKTIITPNKDAWAHGGWSLMNYHLYGKEQPKIYPEPQERPNFLF